jgi:hypothetical protein
MHPLGYSEGKPADIVSKCSTSLNFHKMTGDLSSQNAIAQTDTERD